MALRPPRTGWGRRLDILTRIGGGLVLLVFLVVVALAVSFVAMFVPRAWISVLTGH